MAYNKPTQTDAFSLAGVASLRILASSMRRWLGRYSAGSL